MVGIGEGLGVGFRFEFEVKDGVQLRNIKIQDPSPLSAICLPHAIRENWPLYARSVRRLCIAALQKRKNHRFYMQWLESRIKALAKRPRTEPKAGEQMALPF